MAKKTIKIDFTKSHTSPSGRSSSDIQYAIRACRQVLNNARRKSGAIVEEVADRIANEARRNFAVAQYDGVNDVVVRFSKQRMDMYVPYYGSEDTFEGQYAKTSEGKPTRNPNAMAQRIVEFSGSSLYFIEFGTGAHYNPSGSTHEWLHAYQNIGRTFANIKPIGGYGQGRGKGDAWVYYGSAGTNGSPFKSNPNKILTHGNPPNRCIFNAVQSVKGQLPQIYATAKYAVYY